MAKAMSWVSVLLMGNEGGWQIAGICHNVGRGDLNRIVWTANSTLLELPSWLVIGHLSGSHISLYEFLLERILLQLVSSI